MALELLAPAKLNLTLEVLGRRDDGYHEIASIMQTIDLADRVRVEAAPGLELTLTGPRQLGVPVEGPRNLAYRAAQALLAETGRSELGARIELEKRIPAGMGLGGGSTDAAAVLRGLNRLWGLDLGDAALGRVAASVGSDVAFFLHGGTALVTGRGETVEPLRDIEPMALTLFVSDAELEDKTRRMYAALTASDHSDGRRTRVAAEMIRRGQRLAETDLVNAFDRHVGEVDPPLASAMALCRDAGLAVLAAGSGPGFFAPVDRVELSELLLARLEREWGVTALACRSLTRPESLAAREV